MVSATLNASGVPDYVGLGIGATDAANFARWFTDSPGFNLSTPASITLDETAPGSGVFRYTNPSFFPLDGLLFGNQGRSNNFHFTLHLQGTTTFALTDTFTFGGDDDLWVYINDLLVMDLGGVHGFETSTISGATLAALGLTPGVPYDLDIFFAERHTSASNFNVETSFRIDPTVIPEPTTIGLLGIGLAMAGWVAKRRGRG